MPLGDEFTVLNAVLTHRSNRQSQQMADPRLSLTDRSIAGLVYAKSGQYRVRDTELAGFFALIGSRTKSFMIQADLRVGKARTSIRMKVGEVGETNARDARANAKALIGRIEKGDDPRPPKAPRSRAAVPADPTGVVIASPDGLPTLREAWLRFKASHLERKKRAAGTVRGYTDHMERLFADLLDRPLSEFGDNPLLLADRHDAITKANGPAIANGAMRSFRSVYNHAKKTSKALPRENPVGGVDWNPEHRRDTPWAWSTYRPGSSNSP